MPVDYFASNWGVRAVIRQCRPDDAPRLVDGLASLSAESRLARFLYEKTSFAPDELTRLAMPDDEDQMVRVAVIPGENGGDKIVGLARCMRVAARLPSADLGLVIVDSWQRSGLGTRLLGELRDAARRLGITHWRADILAKNLGMAKLLERIGREELREDLGGGVVRVTVRLQ